MKAPKRHNLPDYVELTDLVETEVASVYFYGNLAVVEVSEGINLSYKNGFSLLLNGLRILGTKPWIYISNRVNSYSVDPNDYKYLNNVPTLKGIAIVDAKESGKVNAQLEGSFSKKPFKIFLSMVDAFEWANTILYKNQAM